MINVTGTLINLYQVCKRETWLHANGIRMEHTSDVVTEGSWYMRLRIRTGQPDMKK